MVKSKLKSDKIVMAAGAAEETRIGFLLDAFPAKNGWNITKVKEMLKLIQSGKSIKQASAIMKTSEGGMRIIVTELRKAAQAGYTLEQYYKLGRPCRASVRKVM